MNLFVEDSFWLVGESVRADTPYLSNTNLLMIDMTNQPNHHIINVCPV